MHLVVLRGAGVHPAHVGLAPTGPRHAHALRRGALDVDRHRVVAGDRPDAAGLPDAQFSAPHARALRRRPNGVMGRADRGVAARPRPPSTTKQTPLVAGARGPSGPVAAPPLRGRNGPAFHSWLLGGVW